MISQVVDYLLGSAAFMPHGYCLLWRPDLVAIHGVSDLLIALSYFSIPVVIFLFMRRRPDFDFTAIAALFVLFIAACGATHLIGLVTLWYPVYGLQALVKLLTATVSVIAAASMWPLLPKVLALPSPAALRESRDQLADEVTQRRAAEQHLLEAQEQLERVLERTEALQAANGQLGELSNVLAEMVRIGSSPDLEPAARIERLLAFGNRLFGTEIAITSEVADGVYAIHHLEAPSGEMAVGQQFALGDTYCDLVFRDGGPLAFHHVAESAAAGHPCYEKTRLEAYIGAHYVVDGKPRGTVNFSSAAPRATAFDATDLHLIALLAQWIGQFIATQEKQDALQAANQRIAEREEHFRLLYLQTPALMHTVDETGRLVEVNELWLEHFGYERDEVIGRRSTDFLCEDSRLRARDALKDFWTDGHCSEVPYRFICKDGSTAEVRLSAIVGIGPHGRPKSFAVLRDVTEELRAKQALEQSYADLERSNQDLAHFASVASHDLRSPLRNIDDLAAWTLEDHGAELPEEARSNLTDLRQCCGRMSALLSGILTYSRAGTSDEGLERVECGALLAETIAMIAPPAGIRIEVAEPMPTLVTHGVQLQQVFVNLINNAIKHHDREQGLIRVTGARDGSTCTFKVADDRPGIAEEFRERVFGMFETLKPHDSVEGSGLGLALVKKLVERHGGEVWIEDPENERGTAFAFSWRAGMLTTHGVNAAKEVFNA
jgi:PAS domain S-box-containing protein